MHGDRVERKNPVKRGKHPFRAEGVQGLVYVQDGQLTEAADLAEFLVVDRYLSASRLLRMTSSGLEYGEVECWIRPTARYWFKVTSTSLAKIGLILWGREMTCALLSGAEISKGIREQEPTSVLDLEKTSAKSLIPSPSCSIARGVQPGP